MKVSFRKNPELQEPEITVSAPVKTPDIERLLQFLSGMDISPLTAYDGDRAIRVSGPDILRFFTDGKTVSVETEEGVFGVRERIYQLEEKYCTGRFVRVSQSEIVNLDKVTAIDLSLTGTVRMQMTSGSSAYVSRRYLRKIREAIGL